MERKGEMRKGKREWRGNLPSEFDDFSASVCAANAFVRSNKSSWNCFESVVVVDKSTDLKILQMEEQRELFKHQKRIFFEASKVCVTTQKAFSASLSMLSGCHKKRQHPDNIH